MKILLINGGRGAHQIIPYLIKNKKLEITSIVNAYDDGKSTGEIRKYFNILGPSDIRKVQQLFLDKNNKDYKFLNNIFNFRFNSGIKRNDALNQLKSKIFTSYDLNIDFNIIKNKYLKKYIYFLDISINHLSKKKCLDFNFSDCSLMNLIYSGAIYEYNHKISEATNFFNTFLPVLGKTIVNSNDIRFLAAIRENCEVIENEETIVNFRSNVRISNLYLFKKKSEIKKLITNHKLVIPQPELSIEAKKYINTSNVIIFCPGTQHSSLYPTYMTNNFSKLIVKNKNAKKIFIKNIREDYETPSFTASDYINYAFKYLNINNKKKYNFEQLFDYNLINLPNKIKRSFVTIDYFNLEKIKVKTIIKNFSKNNDPGKHNGKKIHDEILKLVL